ncbi:Negative regulator of mitotic exit [Mortierella sp. NVP85]|nr:Negative regulator of mitotic exit [Mortierella sp. NVP85]
MAGLFSRKTKKDKDDTSSSNTSRHQGQPSSSSELSQSPYPHQPHQPSVYSSKSSLQQHQHQGSVLSATSFSTHQSNAHGPWSSGMAMSANPFPRFAHTAAYVTTGTDIFVHGGIVKGSAQKDLYVIDPQSLHCQLYPVSGHAPAALTGHSAVALGQYIIYFGGKDAKGKATDTLYVLHTGRKEWNKPLIQTLLPAPRHSHAACVIGTVMYVVGGQLSGYYLNDIASFDMKTLNGKNPSWTTIEPKSDLPPARAGHCAVAYDGKVYIFGGADDQYYYNDIWCFDPQTTRWEAIPAYGNLPASRQGHTACVIDDTMYIYGGMNFEDQLLGDLCAFKFTERRWVSFPNTLESAPPRTEHAMCNVGDKLYILGGQLDLNTANEDTGIIFVLDTAKIRWNETFTTGSLRSAYDNDSIVRAEGGYDDRNSPHHRAMHTPDSLRYQNGSDQNVSQRSTFEQQRNYRENHEQYSGQMQHRQQHQQQHQYQNQHYQQQQQQQQQNQYDGPTENSPRIGLGITSAPLSLDNHNSSSSSLPSQQNADESVHTARRRTIGKPAGFVVHDMEPRRGAHSADEGRRATTLENDTTSDSSRNGGDQLRASPALRHVSSAQGFTNDSQLYHNGNGSAGSLVTRSYATATLQQQHSNPELRRHGSADGLHRQGSQAENTYAHNSIDHEGQHGQSLDEDVQALGRQGTNNSVASTSKLTKEAKELRDLKQREQWLLAEVSMARKKMGERPLSMAILALEDELDACEVDSEKYRVMKALLNVKAELERSKTSIATQAQIASNKVREAERVRTSALQEAAYLKAKVNALQSGEVSALVATETARAADLEKRLTAALAQLDQYEARFVQYETILEHEKESRITAQDREKEASSRADEVQLAHTKALNELAVLHERATAAEATLRETVAKSASSEAGLSSYQQQSVTLFSQISTLKTTVEHQKKSLEKAKLAYTVANERAEQADKLWTQSRKEIDLVQLELASARADMDRSQRETEHWRTKASDTELLWQNAKKENEAMRTLLEEDMNSTTSGHVSKERKHDSIMVITSASRVAELEHELSTLRQLLKDSQMAATQANRDLGDTMIRLSQLEQSSMSARAETAMAQRQLSDARDKMTLLQAQLIRKEEAVEEMVREQENNEAQLGLLRGVMKEHGLLADDLILEALNQSVEGMTTSSLSPLKMKIQEAERRAADAESRLEGLAEVKRQQQERIHQLEADYQTAAHYAQGAETMLQQLRDEAAAAQSKSEALRINLAQLEDLHAARSGESTSEWEGRVRQLEQSLAETTRRLNKTVQDLEHAHELNRVTGQELEDALDALKQNKQQPLPVNGVSKRHEELEVAMDNAQRMIQSLQHTNQDLREQLRASENKISLLLDNFQGPESVRNSVASLSGLTINSSFQQHHIGLHGPSSPPPLNSPPMSISTRSMSPASPSSAKMSSGRSAAGGTMTNSQKLEEYEKLIEEMTLARKQYED